jgi:hypothetical protein
VISRLVIGLYSLAKGRLEARLQPISFSLSKELIKEGGEKHSKSCDLKDRGENRIPQKRACSEEEGEIN